MSVALDWPAMAPVPEAPTRPHLTLVPPLPTAPERRPGLTRRGRLLRTLCVFTVAMIAVLHALDPAEPRPDLAVDHVAIVQVGQSLTEVARAELPALAVDEGIRRIKLVNGLQSSGIYPGQELRIPVNR
ncbi:MAG: LysM peptidoglycan-binding domain-containing protein [Austwickia sp.]|nr:LysM peptidoglycan-binding domain-containing protein [Actinomycetota bacterium]MCB1251680.1 LysM peptidoglycan-binding domain-containing protein [Austwickia sp.]MCO5308683.1 LysM peptidoglycan-binding domain-containing protein [Austwickia sp.]